MVGEAWSVIAGKGSKFQDMNNPQPVVQVGAPGSSGVVEITDIIFSTIGPAGGAIVVEWNVKQITQGGGGAGCGICIFVSAEVQYILVSDQGSCSDCNSKLPDPISKPRTAHRTEMVVRPPVWLPSLASI
jgi:hypothetical protein